jgi:D-alanyl-D-alanine carboxypeptidase
LIVRWFPTLESISHIESGDTMNESHTARNGSGRRAAFRAGAALLATVIALAGIGSAAAATPPHRTETTATGDPYRARLQGALDDLRELGVVGAQGRVSVGHRDTVARSGLADRYAGRPMPVNGHFRIGSNTKTFVAVVVLQLVGEGKLSLEDTVDRWLPGVVSGNGNDGARITIRNLLQHTSGLYNYTQDLPALGSADDFDRHRYDHYDLADLAALAMRHPPVFAPGARWEYSNTGYVLAAMVVERVTGQSWAAQVRSRILIPLGLRDTSYPYDRPVLPRPHARSYQQFQPGGPLVDVSVFNPTAPSAAGGMESTAADLVRFWRGLQRGELLRPAQLAEMRRTVLADSLQDVLPGLRYGLGVFWVPSQCGGYWGHPGDVPGTSTVNAVTARGDRAVVIYRNTGLADPAAGNALDERAFRLMDEVICG